MHSFNAVGQDLAITSSREGQGFDIFRKTERGGLWRHGLFRAATFLPPLHRFSIVLPPATPRNSQDRQRVEPFGSSPRPTSPRTQTPLFSRSRSPTHIQTISVSLIFLPLKLLSFRIQYLLHRRPSLIHFDCMIHAPPSSLWPAMRRLLGFHRASARKVVSRKAVPITCMLTSTFEPIPLLLDPGGNPYPHYPRSTRNPWPLKRGQRGV